MYVSRGQFWAAFWTLFALLGATLGAVLSSSGTEIVYRSVPAATSASTSVTQQTQAAKAPSTAPTSTHAPAASLPTMTSTFDISKTTTTNSGYPLTRYTCSKNLTPVDVPVTNGPVTTVGDSSVSVAIKDDTVDYGSGNLVINVTLGANTTLPGMIVHVNPSSDPYHIDGVSDISLGVHLVPGQAHSFTLEDWRYLPDYNYDAFGAVTFCMG